MISKITIDDIKNQMDIVDVVGDFVTLKKSGSSYKALSPFSAEKTPSFYVVPSKQIFKDFSSGKGGDAITFIMEIDGLSYMEALRFLAKKYAIEIIEEERTDEQMVAQNKRESLYILTNYAKDYFCDKLNNTDAGKNIGLTYFKERGFSDETVKKFELGYSLDEWTGLMDAAVENGYNAELLEEAGLIVKGENKTYDRFRARVMFPIHNITGKTIAFGARTLSKEKNQPKYLNSPETELYHKSKVLYGLFQSKLSIRKEDNVFLVEGYTDVISMHQAGVENVVSSSGTALTMEQVKLIKRYTSNVTMLFDGDAAGMRAAIRGIDLLLEGDLDVKAVALPDGEDPDSYSRKLSVSAFRNYVEAEAKDIIQFKVKLFLEEAGNDPIKKAGVIRDIVGSISKISDPVKRAIYIKECSTLMELSEQVLISELNKLLFEKRKGEKAAYEPVAEAQYLIEQEKALDEIDIVSVIEFQEKESIRVLVNYGKENILGADTDTEEVNLLNYFLEEADEIQFTNPTYKRILEIFKERLAQGEIIDSEYLLAEGDEEIKRTVVDLITHPYEVSSEWKDKHKILIPKEIDQLRDVTFTNILRLKFRIVQHLIEEENKKLKVAKETADIDRMLDEIKDLKKIEMSIAQLLGNVTV
jgi:DNA primase